MRKTLFKLLLLFGTFIIFITGYYFLKNVHTVNNNGIKSKVLDNYYYEVDGIKDEEAINLFKELNSNKTIKHGINKQYKQ